LPRPVASNPIDAHSATGGEMPPGKKPSIANLPEDIHMAQARTI
jgi:hypothetical protein